MKSLKSMSFEQLLALKDEVETMIAQRATSVKKQLEEQLSKIESYARRSTPVRRSHALKGRTLAPKYRNPKNRQETWAGRGIMPRWLKAMVAKGHKPEEFAVAQGQPSGTRRGSKKKQ